MSIDPSSVARTPRLMYAAGPGDIIGTYRHWREGHDDPGQVAMTYSGQFYDVCRELGARGYAFASHPRHEVMSEGAFRIEHRAIPFIRSSGPLYHLGQALMGLRMVIAAVRYRIDAAVICDGTCHWFPLRLLPMLGVKVIPTIHCMLWRKSAPPPGRAMRLIRRLDLPFWRRSAGAVMSASGDISRQLDELTGGDHRPVIEFLPTYRRGTFAEDAEPRAFGFIPGQERLTPFRVLFAGRIERNKGVFDLLEVARRFQRAGRKDIEFDLCGAGSVMENLKREVDAAGLSDSFRLHGHRTRPEMRETFRQAHALIVPTTTDFAEGFNQVVVEGVLAGRPVITSSVCPALEYVRAAIVEVPPDDIGAYQSAILTLLDDRELYDRKRRACLSLQDQFYDPERGWAAALKEAIGIHPAIEATGSGATRSTDLPRRGMASGAIHGESHDAIQ